MKAAPSIRVKQSTIHRHIVLALLFSSVSSYALAQEILPLLDFTFDNANGDVTDIVNNPLVSDRQEWESGTLYVGNGPFEPPVFYDILFTNGRAEMFAPNPQQGIRFGTTGQFRLTDSVQVASISYDFFALGLNWDGQLELAISDSTGEVFRDLTVVPDTSSDGVNASIPQSGTHQYQFDLDGPDSLTLQDGVVNLAFDLRVLDSGAPDFAEFFDINADSARGPGSTALPGNFWIDNFLIAYYAVLGNDIPLEIYPQVLTSLPPLPAMRERLGRFAWPEEPTGLSTTQICKEKGVQFSCPTTPEQQEFFLTGQGLDVPYKLDRDYWIRVGGSFDSYSNLDGTVVDAYDQNSFFLQAGKDIYQHRYDDGSVAWVDVIGHVVQATAEAAGGGERVESLSFGLGLTGTWLSVDGYYVDAQAQINRAASDLSSASFGTIAEGHSAYVGAASLEVGKHIGMNNGWSLTPQAQFTAVRAIADGFSTDGAVVDDIDATRSELRVGAILEKELQTEGGRTDIYSSLDFIQTLEGSSTVLVNGVALDHDRSAPLVQVGLGFDRRWDDRNMSIYGELSTALAIDGPEDVQSISASVGFAFEW